MGIDGSQEPKKGNNSGISSANWRDRTGNAGTGHGHPSTLPGNSPRRGWGTPTRGRGRGRGGRGRGRGGLNNNNSPSGQSTGSYNTDQSVVLPQGYEYGPYGYYNLPPHQCSPFCQHSLHWNTPGSPWTLPGYQNGSQGLVPNTDPPSGPTSNRSTVHYKMPTPVLTAEGWHDNRANENPLYGQNPFHAQNPFYGQNPLPLQNPLYGHPPGINADSSNPDDQPHIPTPATTTITTTDPMPIPQFVSTGAAGEEAERIPGISPPWTDDGKYLGPDFFKRPGEGNW